MGFIASYPDRFGSAERKYGIMSLFWWALGAIAVLWSLLAIFRAPTLFLFYLALVATEYGNIVAAICLLLAVASLLLGNPAGVLLAVAALIFCSPSWRAGRFARLHGLDFPFSAKLPRLEVKQLSLTYGEGLRAECFFTPGTAKRPLVLVVHGGGWTQGDILDNADFMRQLARSGCLVASVSYGLAPAARWPSQREDVQAGYQAIMLRREEFSIDQVFVLGCSAGGQIASAFACWDKAPPLRGCICFYTPFDMRFAYEHGREDDMLRSPHLLRQYLGGTPAEAPENYRSASACHLLHRDSPPFLLLHGTRDELVWILQSRRFAERAKEVGARCTLLELPWATHAFDYRAGGPGSRVALAAIHDFIFPDGPPR